MYILYTYSIYISLYLHDMYISHSSLCILCIDVRINLLQKCASQETREKLFFSARARENPWESPDFGVFGFKLIRAFGTYTGYAISLRFALLKFEVTNLTFGTVHHTKDQ